MYKHARYTSTETRIFNLFICVHGNSSPIKCMETAKWFGYQSQRSWTNDSRHEKSGSNSSGSSCHGCQREQQHYIYTNAVFVEHCSKKIQAECHSFVPVLASLLQTLKSAGSIVVEFWIESLPLSSNMRFAHVRANTKRTHWVHTHLAADEKDILKNSFFNNSIKIGAKSIFCPFCADFNGMHSVTHMCGWHGKVSEKNKSFETAVLSSHNEHRLCTHTTYAAMQQWTKCGCHIWHCFRSSNFWMMDFFSEIPKLMCVERMKQEKGTNFV